MAEREGGPQRLRTAFWTLLEQRSYAAITVRDVVRVANLNKNTFYYHYGTLDDLAADALAHNVPVEVFSVVLRRLMTGQPSSDALAALRDRELAGDFPQRYHRLMLAVGDHTSPALLDIIKTTMLAQWGALLGVDLNNLGEESTLAMDFLFGGITAMLNHYARREREGKLASSGLDSAFFARLSEALPPVIWQTLREDGVALPASAAVPGK